MTDNEIMQAAEQVYAKIKSNSIDIEQLKEIVDLTGSTIPVAKDGKLGKAKYESLTLDRISDNDIDGLSAASPVTVKQAADTAGTSTAQEQSATAETVIKRVAATVSTAEPEPQKATVTDASAPRSVTIEKETIMSNKYLDYNGLKYYDSKLRSGAVKVGKAALADTATKANGVNWGSAGVIPLANIPQGALERVVVVADDTARFKLTTGQAQLGDTIKVTSTGRMYIVVDESKMNSADGYMEYSAGKAATADSATNAQHATKADSATEANHAASASSVAWSGVTGKPSTYAPSAHNHPSSQVTNVDALPTQNGNRAATGKSLNQNLSNLNKGLDDLSNGKADKATTLAGYGITDAYTKANTYAKTETYSKTEIDSKLSGVQASMVAITNAEIDTICNS